MNTPHTRQPACYLIVLDSVGIGEAPDAAAYGDTGSATLQHIAQAAAGLNLPTLQSMGLGNITTILPRPAPILGVNPIPNPIAAFGAMQEASHGKDTTTGHWEIAGLKLDQGFRVFPHDYPSFPPQLVNPIQARIGRTFLGNKAASGIAIIQELGPEHVRTGSPILYTSADSVLQIAAHEDVIPLPELYAICQAAREQANAYNIGRVIARPFIGKPGAFTRTENRRDFSYPLPEPTLLNILCNAGIPVTSVGKIDDIFNQSGLTRILHVENNRDAEQHTLNLAAEQATGLIFVNLIDFDMLYGHRRDPAGYARALTETDAFLAKLLARLTPTDCLIITADHGNDPTFTGTDHTREYVPLLVHCPARLTPQSLGIRKGFYDIAQSIASFFGIPPIQRGSSFLPAGK